MKKTSIITGSAVLLSLVLAVPTYAQGNAARGQCQGRGNGDSSQCQGNGNHQRLAQGRGPQGMGQFNDRRGQQAPGVTGTVASVSGTTLTVTSRAMGGNSGSTATYTVDASAATIKKITTTTAAGTKPTEAVIKISDLAVGNTVMVTGTVTGTTVKATAITVGAFPAQRDGEGNGIGREAKLGLGLSGTVATISGTTVTVTTDRRGNQEDGTFTVDASTAVIKKLIAATVAGASTGSEITITVASLASGDSVIVKGAVTGTTVKATEITVRPHATEDQPQQLRAKDQKRGPWDGATVAGTSEKPAKKGFFASVGNSIKNFFGFFKSKK